MIYMGSPCPWGLGHITRRNTLIPFSLLLCVQRTWLFTWSILIYFFAGLSFLISSSINEDRYGVVQKDLPTIIATLFTLQKVNHEMSLSKIFQSSTNSLYFYFFLQTVDKHKGVTISSKKNRSETRDLQLKQELRTAIKSSIYRIISTFGDHLDSLPISNEWHKKINNYKLFHEG